MNILVGFFMLTLFLKGRYFHIGNSDIEPAATKRASKTLRT